MSKLTHEERKELVKKRILSENESLQYKSALARQNELEIDQNFVSLITGILTACNIVGAEPGEKASSSRDGLDAIWAEKTRRVEEGDTNTDYSKFGEKKYSYSEVRAEAEGV